MKQDGKTCIILILFVTVKMEPRRKPDCPWRKHRNYELSKRTVRVVTYTKDWSTLLSGRDMIVDIIEYWDARNVTYKYSACAYSNWNIPAGGEPQ